MYGKQHVIFYYENMQKEENILLWKYAEGRKLTSLSIEEDFPLWHTVWQLSAVRVSKLVAGISIEVSEQADSCPTIVVVENRSKF